MKYWNILGFMFLLVIFSGCSLEQKSTCSFPQKSSASLNDVLPQITITGIVISEHSSLDIIIKNGLGATALEMSNLVIYLEDNVSCKTFDLAKLDFVNTVFYVSGPLKVGFLSQGETARISLPYDVSKVTSNLNVYYFYSKVVNGPITIQKERISTGSLGLYP